MFDYANKQLKRTYELVIGKPNSGKGLQIIGDEDANEGLQIAFRISKNIDNKENSNESTIDIYNLSEDSIKYIQQDQMSIILKVGYKGTGNTLLFQGIVSEVETDDRSRQNDRKTTLRCVPADSLVYKPSISKTFPANTTPRQVINYLIGQTETITRASFNSENIDKTFPFGYPVEGSVKSILSELSRDFDFHWRIDGKRLYVNDPNKYQSPNSVERAFEISPTTGLVGLPSYASPDGKRVKDDTVKKSGVKFRSLINPLIIPGSAVSLKSSTFDGIFRVNSVEYNGDWRGQTWTAEYYCAKLSGREV